MVKQIEVLTRFKAEELFVRRVNENRCPICNEVLLAEEMFRGKEITAGVIFEEHNGIRQPIHRRHIKYDNSSTGE